MEIIHAIGLYCFLFLHSVINSISIEEVPKGSNDRPIQDVVIVDSGEVWRTFWKLLFPLNSSFMQQLDIVHETDADGNQVPLHAEL
jgi:hypothetical protein